VLAESHRTVLRGVTRPPLATPVLAVEGSEDPVLPPAAMEVWRDLTDGAFGRTSIPGTHAAPIVNAEAMAVQLMNTIDDITTADITTAEEPHA
jgi:surfactin synthase thioesterase subunit